MATADGDVETKAYFRKYSIAIKLYLSLAAQKQHQLLYIPRDIVVAGQPYCRSTGSTTI
jgi:hypothetical protein